MKLYHNPRCSKSRQAKAILDEKGIDYEVVEYLKEAPSMATLKKLFKALGVAPQEIVRKGEAIYKSDFKDRELSADQWARAIHEHPILLERPILDNGRRAVVGRPPEKVLELL